LLADGGGDGRAGRIARRMRGDQDVSAGGDVAVPAVCLCAAVQQFAGLSTHSWRQHAGARRRL
jgi:hypothetical protein